MSADWKDQENPQPNSPAMVTPPTGNIEANSAQTAGAPMAGDVPDSSAFTPDQWNAYQEAYAQAMQAQHLYTQAQQWYLQAQQAGQAEQAQQAYTQAAQAQEMYSQAHNNYLSILQQVQQNMQAGQAVQPVMQTGQPVQPVMQAGQPVQPVMQAGQPVQPVMQAGQPVQPVMQAGQVGQEIPMGQPSGIISDPFAQAESVANSFGGDDFVPWTDDQASLEGGGSSIWWWLIGILVLTGGFVGLYVSTQPPTRERRLQDYKPEQRQLTLKEQAEIRRQMLGEDKEKPTKNLRKLLLSITNLSWTGIILSGQKDCRTFYGLDKNFKKLYATEGSVPQKDQDYIYPPSPPSMVINSLALPSKGTSYSFLQGINTTFLAIRAKVGRQTWLLLYPLVGNPLMAPNKPKKKKSDDDPPACGSSQLPSYILKEKLILIGTGRCDQASSALGVVPSICLPKVYFSKDATVRFFQFGRRKKFSLKGTLLVDNTRITLKKHSRGRVVDSLYRKLITATQPTPTPSGKKWIFIDKQTGQVWSINSRLRLHNLRVTLPRMARKFIVRAQLSKRFLRIVFPSKLVKYQIKRRKLIKIAEYKFGKRVHVIQATWGSHGKILLLRTKKNKLYQFSENQ